MILAELGTIVTGKTPSTKCKEYWNGCVPFVTPKDIQGTKHIFSTERNISDIGLISAKGVSLPPNSICVSCIGNIGYVGKTTTQCISNQQINTIIPFSKVNSDYVYYLIKWLWPFFKNYEGQSTTLSILNKTQFSKIEIPKHSLQQQNAIAAVLNCFDDKIEENERINDNLADLLQTIYQERFDDAGLVANQGTLSDICSYSRDKVAVSKLNISTYFSTENMLSGKAGSTVATSLPTTARTTACHKGDTLVSNIRPYFKKIVYCEDECGCSTDVLCFTPDQPQYSAYLFSTLYVDKFFAFMVAGSKGTKMPRGDKQQIMTYPIVLPSEAALDEFNAVVLPLIEQIYSNRAENKRLSLLRNTLLPKLMSGELDVSAIEI